MSSFDDLRAALTRYKEKPENMVLEADYQAIVEFIQWLETNPTPPESKL